MVRGIVEKLKRRTRIEFAWPRPPVGNKGWQELGCSEPVGPSHAAQLSHMTLVTAVFDSQDSIQLMFSPKPITLRKKNDACVHVVIATSRFRSASSTYEEYLYYVYQRRQS